MRNTHHEIKIAASSTPRRRKSASWVVEWLPINASPVTSGPGALSSSDVPSVFARLEDCSFESLPIAYTPMKASSSWHESTASPVETGTVIVSIPPLENSSTTAHTGATSSATARLTCQGWPA